MVKSQPDRSDAADLSPAAIDKRIRELVERRAEIEFEKLLPLRNEYAALMERINEAVKQYGLTAVKFLAMPHAEAEKWIREVTHSHVVGPTAPAKPKIKVPPKYRSPDDPELTWTGRGATPIWVRDFLRKKRGKLHDLLIDPEAAAAAKPRRKSAKKAAKKAAKKKPRRA